MNYEQYTGRTGTYISAEDSGGGAYATELSTLTSDNLIPVFVSSNSGATDSFPRKVNFAIGYYQVDDYNKKIVYARIVLSEVDTDSTRTDYTFQMNFFALGYLALILNFAFPLNLFISLFFVVGAITVGLGFAFWVIMRLTTQLQNPPELKIWGMLALVAPPPAAGVYLAVIPVFTMLIIGNYFVNGYFFINPIEPVVAPLGEGTFDLTASSWEYGAQLTTEQQEKGRTGRIGLVFMCISASCLAVGSKLFYPKGETKREKEIARMRDELANKEAIWAPVLWKKANFILCSYVMIVEGVMMIEFSYWGSFGDLIWQNIVMLMMVGIFNDSAIEYQVKELLPAAPLGAANALFQGVVTYGSPNFLSFLMSNYVGVGIQLVERVYLDAIMDSSYGFIENLLDFILKKAKSYLPKYLKEKKEDDPKKKKVSKAVIEVKKREIDDVQEEETSGDSVEPIVASYTGVSVDTLLVFYTPFMVYLWMQYRNQIYIPLMYGIRQSDMLIYMMFQVCLIPFQPIFDVLVHACNELFWGWKIYEYLVYSRYRFLQRESRWKGLENTLDECIEESLRTIDQMCFSSQYYFMMTIQVSGMMFGAFGLEIMQFAKYNLFADAGLIYILIYMLVVHIVLEKTCIFLAVHLKLWKIKHENTDWHLKLAEEDEIDIPDWEDVKGASHEAYLMNQRITSETFRYKFLNYNRAWIINQLPQLLTPRTLRRSRPYLINQLARILNARRDDISDDSDADKDKKFGPVSLNNSSRNIIRWWLGQARRRLRLKSIVDPLIRKARGAECESCLSRKQLQVEYEIDVDHMAHMYDKAFPEDEEIDQVQWKAFWNKNQKYHTICLQCLSKRREKQAKDLMKGTGGFESLMYDNEQEEYPEWGPIYLSAASKAILLNWYRKAQRIRQAKKGSRRGPRVAKAVSDDEGDDVPAEWAKQLLNISAATRAIAIKWSRTARANMQKRAGKGSSLRESQVEIAQDGTFSSGKKSLTVRK